MPIKKKPVSARKTTVTALGKPAKRGGKIMSGHYRLLNVKSNTVFVGTHVATINKGKIRLAIFSVPKG